MTEIKIKYMISLFTNASDIIPNASTYSRLATALGDTYIPITIQEMTPSGSKNRIAMENQELGLKVLFLMNRIIIEKYPTNLADGDSLGTFESFCDLVNEVIESLLGVFEKDVNRLSFVSTYLLKKEDEENINPISSKLFVFPQSHNETNTFEWNWRMVRSEENTFGEYSEKMNYITSINRIRGMISDNTNNEEFEGLNVEFDFNTIAENQAMRFDIEKIKSFYAHAKIWHNSHYRTMMNYIKN